MIAASASIACHRNIGSGIFAKVICNITGFIFNVTLRHVVLSIAGKSGGHVVLSIAGKSGGHVVLSTAGKSGDM